MGCAPGGPTAAPDGFPSDNPWGLTFADVVGDTTTTLVGGTNDGLHAIGCGRSPQTPFVTVATAEWSQVTDAECCGSWYHVTSYSTAAKTLTRLIAADDAHRAFAEVADDADEFDKQMWRIRTLVQTAATTFTRVVTDGELPEPLQAACDQVFGQVDRTVARWLDERGDQVRDLFVLASADKADQTQLSERMWRDLNAAGIDFDTARNAIEQIVNGLPGIGHLSAGHARLLMRGDVPNPVLVPQAHDILFTWTREVRDAEAGKLAVQALTPHDDETLLAATVTHGLVGAIERARENPVLRLLPLRVARTLRNTTVMAGGREFAPAPDWLNALAATDRGAAEEVLTVATTVAPEGRWSHDTIGEAVEMAGTLLDVSAAVAA